MSYSENTSEELPELQRTVANFVAEHGIEAPVHIRLLERVMNFNREVQRLG